MNPSPAPFDSPDADVTLSASNGVSFKVHSIILSLASPFFRDLFTLPQPAADKNEPTAGIRVAENSKIIRTLLMIIYPIENPPVKPLSHLDGVLNAALKYDMALAVQVLRRLLVSSEFLEKEPLRVYAIACRHDLEEEAKIASTYTLTINILDAPLTDELKLISAYDYHRLLVLHQQRGAAAKKLLLDTNTVRCKQCTSGKTFSTTSGSHGSAQITSLWWHNWSTRAIKELRLRPTSHVIFSLLFLAESSEGCNSCKSCETTLLSHGILKELKERIDDLPATV